MVELSGALPVEFYASRLANLPSFKVDNVTLKIQQLEKMLRYIPTRSEVQSIVVLNSRPAGSRPNPASISVIRESLPLFPVIPQSLPLCSVMRETIKTI